MRMVASFYVLCVINNSILGSRQDCAQLLESLFTLHHSTLFQFPSRLIRQALALFCYFYVGGLWEENKDVLVRYLEYVATMASDARGDSVAVEQACATL